MKVCMKCKRAFEDEKKVCDFCGEPLIEIRETDEVKKERIKKNPMVFAVAGIAIALVAGLGIGSLTMKQLVTGKNEKSAVQSVETDEENVLGEVKKEKGVTIEDEEEETDEDVVPEIKVGETWTVDGLWKITINSVTETDERESYNDRENPEAVYIVDYTYENLGYKSGDPVDLLYHPSSSVSSTVADPSLYSLATTSLFSSASERTLIYSSHCAKISSPFSASAAPFMDTCFTGIGDFPWSRCKSGKFYVL